MKIRRCQSGKRTRVHTYSNCNGNNISTADQTEDTTDFILRDSTPEKKGDDVYRNIRVCEIVVTFQKFFVSASVFAKVSVVGASLPLISKWCKGIFCQYDFFNHKEVTVRPLRDVNGVIIHRGKVLFKNEHVLET